MTTLLQRKFLSEGTTIELHENPDGTAKVVTRYECLKVFEAVEENLDAAFETFDEYEEPHDAEWNTAARQAIARRKQLNGYSSERA